MFVGGISWNTSDADLSQAFGQFGEIVEATVVTDRETGRSRGFGFVVFADDADADKALSAMNGSELDGRTIRVDEAHDRKPRREFGGGGGGGGRGGGGGGGRWS